MAIVTDIVNPVELSAFVRTLDPALYGFTLDQFLPNQTRDDVEYAFTRIDQARADMASYRAFDVEADLAARPGFARVRGQIPPMSRKIVLGEEATLRLRQLRGEQSLIADQVFNDAQIVTEALLARIEFARGDALFNGSVSFTTDRGFVSAQVNYGSVTALTAPGVLWTTPATATPLKDLRQMKRDYMAANNGQVPAVIVMADEALQAILTCVEVKNYAAIQGVAPSIVGIGQLQTIMASLGLPPIVTYDTAVSVNGSITRVTPRTKLAMLPAASTGNFGETTFGITAEQLVLLQRGIGTVASAPGLTGVVMTTEDPVATWTKVAGLVIPVVKDTKKIGTATVIA